jgi:hypothetical protein
MPKVQRAAQDRMMQMHQANIQQKQQFMTAIRGGTTQNGQHFPPIITKLPGRSLEEKMIRS